MLRKWKEMKKRFQEHQKKRIEGASRENVDGEKMKIEEYNLRQGRATNCDAQVSKLILKFAETKPLPPLPLQIVKQNDEMDQMPQLSRCTKTRTP